MSTILIKFHKAFCSLPSHFCLYLHFIWNYNVPYLDLMRAFLIILLLLSCSMAKEITGKVVGVTDGDTITLLDNENKQHKIRLHGIDAPEQKQDYGQRSKQLLSALVFEDVVRIEYKSKDRYGRILGKIYNGSMYVNAEMIRLGMAWHYKQYCKDKNLAELEEAAKAGKVGLWSRKDAVPPWKFREKK